MPELPDITIYIERLKCFIQSKPLEKVRVLSPFFLRTAVPPIRSVEGMKVQDIERLGKRIVFVMEEEYFFVLHLMVSGRLHWEEKGCKIAAKKGLAAFDFENGSLLVTEVSTKKRASLHLVKGREELNKFDRKGLEVLNTTLDEFKEAIMSESHTLKRTLTDPTILSGIGNAYSDEILHRAKLSPILLTKKITDKEIEKLFEATKEILTEWTDRLRKETGDGFPKKVTAFRKEMSVHGKYEKPCPVCGTTVQRIRYSTNETNYCPTCQTEGKLLADRALSRLLKSDWPRTLDELDDLYDKS
ncbi:MAG: DNA-formamidopyrimidine glycosylase family protein [Ignavibacteria bacterium]